MHENNENKNETQSDPSSHQESQQESASGLGIPGAIVLGAALIAASIYFGLAGVGGGFLAAEEGGGRAGNNPQPNQPSQPTAPGETVDVTAGDLPVLGDSDAPVLVVEWSDFQCPFCGRFYSQVESQLIEQYVDTGKVRFAYRDFAFLGKESTDASNAARCANEQGKFWEYHDHLFDNQNGENRGAFSKENLKGFAQDLGLDAAQFNDCLDNDKYVDAVNADVAAGRAAGVTGTPTTFINGRVVNGAQPFAAFQQVIEDELNK